MERGRRVLRDAGRYTLGHISCVMCISSRFFISFFFFLPHLLHHFSVEVMDYNWFPGPFQQQVFHAPQLDDELSVLLRCAHMSVQSRCLLLLKTAGGRNWYRDEWSKRDESVSSTCVSYYCSLLSLSSSFSVFKCVIRFRPLPHQGLYSLLTYLSCPPSY